MGCGTMPTLRSLLEKGGLDCAEKVWHALHHEGHYVTVQGDLHWLPSSPEDDNGR